MRVSNRCKAGDRGSISLFSHSVHSHVPHISTCKPRSCRVAIRSLCSAAVVAGGSHQSCTAASDQAASADGLPAAHKSNTARMQNTQSPSRRHGADMQPVLVCRTITLHQELSVQAGRDALSAQLSGLMQQFHGLPSGCIRVEVPFPRGTSALRWLQGQKSPVPAGVSDKLQAAAAGPHMYFSGRHSSAPDTTLTAKAEACTKGWFALAGAGAAWLWRGRAAGGFDGHVVHGMKRFLAEDQPRVRVVGGTRFDTDAQPAQEWAALGAFTFALPLLEYLEQESGGLLAVMVAWEPQQTTPASAAAGVGAATMLEALQRAHTALEVMCPAAPVEAGSRFWPLGDQADMPNQADWHEHVERLLSDLGAAPGAPSPVAQLAGLDVGSARQEYMTNGQEGLDELLRAVQGQWIQPSVKQARAVEDSLDSMDDLDGANTVMAKVVLARKSTIHARGRIDPLWMLAALQERDPRAYQLLISDGDGMSFLACTPERLYVRTGRYVASEAVAGTRPRGPPGDVERDFWLALDLLRSDKDHREFVHVMDWIKDALATCAERVDVELPKSVLKQGSMQHLYGRLAATVRPSINDAHILSALHPTPAVCGRPRGSAMQWLQQQEQFDRGFYSGPFGWISGQGAEFAVAIRSALVQSLPSPVRNGEVASVAHLYAGVGIVPGSNALSEWQELDLKTRQYRLLLQAPPSLLDMPNINQAWCGLLVEECCRNGLNMFCIAPGSRSSPLTWAIANHPRARLHVCIDERSLGFWAVGYGRAAGRPAVVITSSGTAVANLLPACVEAAQSEIPLLCITADRPSDMRDTGANQTIDQVRILGGFTRWFQDVPAPYDGVHGRVLLSTLNTAMRYCMGWAGAAGPVHLNMQFKEPLAPTSSPWDRQAFTSALQPWMCSPGQVYTRMASHSPTRSEQVDPALLLLLRTAKRGLLVMGELASPADAAAAADVAHVLGWPVAADILSGARMLEGVVHHIDHILLGDKAWWSTLRPDVILQLGPRLTSKRLQQFLEWSASETHSAPSTWVFVGTSAARHDAAHLVRWHGRTDILPGLAKAMGPMQLPTPYSRHLTNLNQVAATEIDSFLCSQRELTEPAVARQLSQLLPAGHALFLGNSMPIRDMDMYASSRPGSAAALCTPTAANRGASGIDGVLSSAAGFAEGLGRPTTLVIGDLSFLHDINGLNLLRTSEARPPLTVVLVNNRGGAIFSFLPIASAVPEQQFTPLWTTPQNVDLEAICRAHGLPHQRVGADGQLAPALQAAWGLNRHSVVEVMTDRTTNVALHKHLQNRVQRVVHAASSWWMDGHSSSSITGLSWFAHTLPLQRPLTTSGDLQKTCLLLELYMETANKTTCQGSGEVAPLIGLHLETLDQCEAQLHLIKLRLLGARIPATAALLGGNLGIWWRALGLEPDDLYPSVRMGLEMALLQALATARQDTAMLPFQSPAPVAINGLISSSSVEQAVVDAVRLVGEGYTSLKIKVARKGTSVQHDASTVEAIRAAVGPNIALRADANRGWTLDQAITFGQHVRPSELEYVEEPIAGGENLADFFNATGVAVALDESLEGGPQSAAILLRANTPGVVAAVLKPSKMGGPEASLALADIAFQHGLQVVISSSFEGPLGLSHLVNIASAVNDKALQAGIAAAHHGLGTASWFDLSSPTATQLCPGSQAQPADKNVSAIFTAECASQPRVQPGSSLLSWTHMCVLPSGATFSGITLHPDSGVHASVLLLHGFLGSKEDWIPYMHALAAVGVSCSAVDLPGHGGSSCDGLSVEETADALASMIVDRGLSSCTLVGYSMGARVCMAIAIRHPGLCSKLMLLSGTPGIKDPTQANLRRQADAVSAHNIVEDGLAGFLDFWYQQPLWASLRLHPALPDILSKRISTSFPGYEQGLAQTLMAMSTGRMEHMWGAISGLRVPVLLVTGEMDSKYCTIAAHMTKVADHCDIRAVTVQGAGHAIHIERPLQVLELMLNFVAENGRSK